MNFSYRRCSTEEQHNGPVAQSDRIAAWAKGQGIVVEQDFFDDGVSGSIPLAERPQGSEMLDALKKRTGERLVVVARLDRLFRSVADAAATISCWQTAGITLVAIAEGFDMTNPYGRAMAMMASVFAELEREMIRTRTKAALDSKRARGKCIGTVPYGWDAVSGNLIENPAEQAALSNMKVWRACGLTLRQICTKLSEMGVRPKGGGMGWQPQSVASVLKRNGG